MNTFGFLHVNLPPDTRNRKYFSRGVWCHLAENGRKLRMAAGVAVAVIVTLGCTSIVMACPTCKDALAHSDPAQQRMVAGYFYSILFMMSVPFLLVGSFCGYAYMLVRRDRNASPAAPTRHK